MSSTNVNIYRARKNFNILNIVIKNLKDQFSENENYKKLNYLFPIKNHSFSVI